MIFNTYYSEKEIERLMARIPNFRPRGHGSYIFERFEYTLGKALLDGDILVQDIPEAMRLLKMSADKNFAQAQYIFGKLLYRGELTEQDTPKALE